MRLRVRNVVAVVCGLVGFFLGVFLLSGKLQLKYLAHNEGVFLLQGLNGAWLELRDDVLLGDEGRVLGGVGFHHGPLSGIQDQVASEEGAFLEFQWNEEQGYGYVLNHLGGGRVLLTNLARYIDSNGEITRGLFVGGGLPESLRLDSPVRGNDTGMAYFDGHRWSHIWCNTNEGIGSVVLGGSRFAPSDWEFLGSRIDKSTDQELVLVSHHGVNIDGLLLRLERRATFIAGQPYFDLSISLVNAGAQAGRYFYLYSDEPWVGDYGGSAGDIGWVGGRYVQYEEMIDPQIHSVAGMVDYGNSAIGEPPRGRAANFIEWRGGNRPDMVFFANQYEGFGHPSSMLVPLAGDARSLGLYWGPKLIQPGERQSMSLTIGMAQTDALTGFPHKPVISKPALPGKKKTARAS